MAKITTITNPLTGQPAQVDQLDHTAQQIDDAIARALPGGAIDIALQNKANSSDVYTKDEADTLLQNKVNPWINDNGFFGNPVNQRGQAVYTNADYYAPMYGIDRWFTTGNGNKPTANVKDGYIEFVAAGLYNVFGQKKEAKSYAGKTITISAIAKSTQNVGLHIVCFDSEGTNLSDSFTTLYSSSDFQLVQRTIDVPESCTIFQYGFLSLAEGETTVAATAYKVEIGSQQTLAHQENGVWVLNEIPDYGEQLAKCQRYFQTFVTESLRPTNALDFRPVMRATPALSTITVGGKTLYTASADL